MKIILNVIKLIITLTIGISSTLVYAHNNTINKIVWQGKETRIYDRIVLFKLNNEYKNYNIDELLNELSLLKIDGPNKLGRIAVLVPENENILNIIQNLINYQIFEYVQPCFVYSEHSTPNDNLYSYQWAHSTIDSENAWDLTKGSSSITIGVIDSGIPISSYQLSHPDLNESGKYIYGYDYVDRDNYPGDERGHGTHVAGIVAAETNNELYISGINWHSKLYIIRLLDENGYSEPYKLDDAIIEAVDYGCSIINLSLGGTTDNSIIDAIEYADSNDCLIIASAGNNGASVLYPAAYSDNYNNIIAVSAVDGFFNLYSESGYGEEINVAAPGVDILSTLPDYNVKFNQSPFNFDPYYDYIDGTSMAAPHVTGIASLVLSINNSLIPSQVRDIIENSADDRGNGFTEEFGWGIVNSYEALVYTLENYGGTLSGNVKLHSSLDIQSGVTLNIASNAVIDLNDYTITSSGGTINLVSGAQISPYICASTSGSIIGLYNSITTALSNGAHVEVKGGTHNFADSYTINSTKGLYLYNSAELKFPSGKYLNVSGTLTCDNATFTSTSGTWGGIKFQSGSSGRLENINISNATYGLYFNNASTDSTNPSIHIGPSFIENCGNYGIYVYNSSPEIDSCWVFDEPVYINNGHPHIEQCLFDDEATIGYSMTLYSSNPTFYRNVIQSTDAQLTIEATNGSIVFFGNSSPGLNIIEADEYADGVIWAFSGSDVYLGDTDNETPPAVRWATQNSILGGEGASPAYADGTSNVYAENCWWGQTPPPTCMGNVSTSPYLSDPPENVGSSYYVGFYKSISTPLDFETLNDTSWTKAKSMLAIARRKIEEGNYSFAREYYSEVINRYPSSPQAYTALNLGVNLCCKSKEKDVIEFVDELLKNVQNKTLKAAIKSKKVSQLRHLQRIDEAIVVSEQMLKENTDTEYELYALFDLFNYYHKDLDKPELALEYLAQLKDKYPDKNLTLIARSDVGEDVFDIKLAKRDVSDDSEQKLVNAIPATYELYSAFPNPFNPSTKMKYDLPKASKVVCSIYDLKGNLIREYNFNKDAGTHNIVWNARNVSSGIYLIRFTIEASDGSESFVDYQKVTLLK